LGNELEHPSTSKNNPTNPTHQPTMDNGQLTPEQIEHFVKHGWLKIPNAIDKKYLELWMSNLWTRLGWDKDDKTTWTDEYVKMPRHREVPVEELCPRAWEAACE
jgi:hypothetical protein